MTIVIIVLSMRRRELEDALKDLGWAFSHHGGKHDAWRHGVMTHTIFVPRHNEIAEGTARRILKQARGEV